MVWVKLDENFTDHPKLAELGDVAAPAGWLHTAALCYCNRHLTDGFIPKGQVGKLAAFEGLYVKVDGRLRAVTTADLVEALIGVRLWEQAPKGYWIHDYLEFQPSRAEHEAKVAKKAAAGRAGGQASAQARAQARATPSGSEKVEAKSNPAPVPVSGSFTKNLKRGLDPVENPGCDRPPSKSEMEPLGALMGDALETWQPVNRGEAKA